MLVSTLSRQSIHPEHLSVVDHAIGAMGIEDKACAVDVTMCERHIGAQPGGGICAMCLQEKLILLWRGEGNSNWDTEEFSITPPLVQDSCDSPPACEPSSADAYPVYKPGTACLPLVFHFRNFQRNGVHELGKSSKSLMREKIDRSRFGLDPDGDQQHQFSCEIKSILKELSALHEKKKLERAEKKRSGTEGGCLSGRHQHDEAAADLSQGPIPTSPTIRDTEAVPVEYDLPKAKARNIEDEDEDARFAKTTLCFNALWPGQLRPKLNMKWARVLVSPILSSNKIAPSKSDLAKTVNGRPKVAIEDVRQESTRDCEILELSTGVNDHIGRPQSTGTQIMPSPAAAHLPPRHVQRIEDEDGSTLEIDKETAMRMEASRITVLTWLESLPSPKAVHFKEQNYTGFPDDLSLGNGVLEMCDEEDVEFDYQSQEPKMENFELADGYNSLSPLEQVDVYNRISSFGKFLRTVPSQIYSSSRMLDIEIAAQ